jgi:hypothetical protein
MRWSLGRPLSDELAATTPQLSESEALQRLGCCGHIGANKKRLVGVLVIRHVASTLMLPKRHSLCQSCMLRRCGFFGRGLE